MELQRRGSGKAGHRPRPALCPGGALARHLARPAPSPAPFLPPPGSQAPSLRLLRWLPPACPAARPKLERHSAPRSPVWPPPAGGRDGVCDRNAGLPGARRGRRGGGRGLLIKTAAESRRALEARRSGCSKLALSEPYPALTGQAGLPPRCSARLSKFGRPGLRLPPPPPRRVLCKLGLLHAASDLGLAPARPTPRVVVGRGGRRRGGRDPD